jgi:hypothetical protein
MNCSLKISLNRQDAIPNIVRVEYSTSACFILLYFMGFLNLIYDKSIYLQISKILVLFSVTVRNSAEYQRCKWD